MAEYHIPLGEQQTWQCLDEFTQGYWEAAFFTSQEEIGAHTFADVSKAAYDRAIKDCLKFQTDNMSLLALAYMRPNYGPAQAGRDFWFTRNGHGVGFWDRHQLGDLGDKLSDACRHRSIDVSVTAGKIDLY